MPGCEAPPGSGSRERSQEKPEEKYAMTQDGWDGHGWWMNEERPNPPDMMSRRFGRSG